MIPRSIERKLARFAIPHLTLYLIGGQVFLYLMALSGTLDQGRVLLVPEQVLAGEYWRLFTFLIDPPRANMIFVFFGWYLFWLMGEALEDHWGTLRYNLFLLSGYLLSLGVSFAGFFAGLFAPYTVATNAFLGGSVFLAFAWLYPDFVLYLFFVLPVKIRWLALLTWIGYGAELIFGGWPQRLLVLAALGNIFIFFGRDIVLRVRTGRRQMSGQAARLAGPAEIVHRCEVCGITSRTHPEMEFRYCSKCAGRRAYCREHLANHVHAVTD